MRGNFNTSNVIGEKAQVIVAEILQKQKDSGAIKAFKRTEHTEYWNKGLDYETDFIYKTLKGSLIFLEVKSLKGSNKKDQPYPTLCVEAYKDNQMEKRPGWWRMAEVCEENGGLARIVFFNRHNNTLYFHDSVKLKETISSIPEYKYRWADDNNEDDSGWLAKIDWDDDYSFLGKIILP